MIGRFVALGFVVLLLAPAATADQEQAQVRALKITVLSTMLAGDGVASVGEWGFAALVEADGRRFLFDTGARPDTVRANLEDLGIDVSGITELIISHNHSDHTGGLLTLRSAFAAGDTLSRARVGRGIFWPRPNGGRDTNGLLTLKADYERGGGRFIEHSAAEQIAPGIWVTGPVPRVHPERNWSGSGRVQAPDGVVEDTIPEDMSLVFDTPSGLVVLSGCGHAGIVNTLEHARKSVRAATIHAALGGFHLFAASDDHLAWTAKQLKGMGLQHFLGAHCTGIEAVFRVREQCALPRSAAVVGSVGAVFELGRGIRPTTLAR